MPCLSLKHRKARRATVVRNPKSSLYQTEPVTADNLNTVPAAVANLVDAALDAEVRTTPDRSSSVTSKKSQTHRKVSVKRAVRPLKLKLLRHSTVKAARKTAAKTAAVEPSSSNVASTFAASTLASVVTPFTSTLQVLHDGDHIRLRPGRTAASSVAERYINSSTTALKASVQNSGPATISTNDAKKPKRSFRHRTSSSTAKAPIDLLAKRSRFGRRRLSRSDLINAESCLGRTLFGPIPAGHRREFFHDRDNIWIWHEGWVDSRRHIRQMTIRYEVRPSGVYKKISAGKYFKLEGDELENFRRATHAYLSIIKQYLYTNKTPAAHSVD